MLDFSDFQKVDLRVGTIVEVRDFPEARQAAYQIWVDFGAALGIKKSSAQLTELYDKQTLLGKQVVAVVNFPPKQIGPFRSEILILGAVHEAGTSLLTTDGPVPNGLRIS